jgi:tetratricopeptide (TPR) repeat protein
MYKYASTCSLVVALTACSHAAPPASPTASSSAARAPSASPGWGPSPERFDKLVRDDFFDGIKGDAEALERGMKRCEEELARDPDNAGALIWHATGLASRAGAAVRAGRPAEAQALMARAMKESEHALELRPRDIDIVVVHGSLMLAMGASMPDPQAAHARTEAGVRDYENVVAAQRQDWPRLSVHGRGQLLYGLADGWERLGDRDKARGYYRRIVGEVPQSPLAPRARAWLDGKPEKDYVRCLGCHEG